MLDSRLHDLIHKSDYVVSKSLLMFIPEILAIKFVTDDCIVIYTDSSKSENKVDKDMESSHRLPDYCSIL